MTDPWGMRQPPAVVDPVAPLPPRLARLAEVEATGIAMTAEDPYAQGFPRADELPEVQALIPEGWRPLHSAPLYCLLPAAWPAEHRTWVPDRMPRVATGGTTSSYFGSISPLDDGHEWEAEERADQARAAELPVPPSGRIWLLRSPWPRIPVAAIYEIVGSLVEHNRGHDEIQQVYQVAREILTWDEARALAACPSQTRELLEAWGQAGRIGEAAAAPVEHRLGPADLADASARTGLDEDTLLEWLESLQTDLDDEAITFINAWRSAGLPGNPPPGASRFTDRDLGELQSWLDAGFDLYAANQLHLTGLESAIRWRNAGFSERDTYDLLRSDPALTPEEARTFDNAGPARARRRDWIYFGFTAAQAADWAATGLTPTEARLWRACLKQPDDVQPGQQFPPQLLEGLRNIGFSQSGDGEMSNSEWDELPDPPGTRGRRARRRAGDDDPWINPG